MKYKASQNISLLDALTQLSPQSSKTTLRSWIKEGRVFIDQKQAKTANEIVNQDQVVSLSNRKKFVGEGIQVLYDDSDIVVIEKPAGLLSVAAAFEKKETAHALLKTYYHPRKVFVVHRLDQDTSGVMVFAFNEAAYNRLKEIFVHHDLTRSYTAIVEGHLEDSEGTWRSYLYEDAQYQVHITDEDDEEAQEAITHYQTLATSRKYSWLNLTLETGRKNQIRVHCQDAGHPVAGDKKYGGRASPIKRLCLHAHLLAFNHPITHKKLRFESTIPEDFYRIINPHKM